MVDKKLKGFKQFFISDVEAQMETYEICPHLKSFYGFSELWQIAASVYYF